MVEKIITIKKRGGGTRKQRVKVLASGKFKFIKNKKSSTKRKAPKRKSAPKRKAPKRRSAPKRKVNKKKKVQKRMAGKKKGFASNIPLINNPTFKKAALGVGTATIGVAVLGLVAPQIANNPIVKPALALLGGGVPGVIAQVVAQGGIGSIQGLLGGNGGNGNANTVNTGFA